MRRFLIAISGCLQFAILTSGECVVVQPVVQRSSDTVRITALLHGKPAKDVKLEFVIAGKNDSRLSLSTDKRGIALTQRLQPGSYRLVATAPDKQTGELYLEVSKATGKQISSFVINLAPPPPLAPDRAKTVEGVPLTERAPQFRGSVIDPSGAIVQGVLIQVFRKTSPAEAVLKVKSDEAGRFAIELAQGAYVAFFEMPGFKTQIVGIQIDPSADSKELQVLMNIGSGC